MHCMQLVWKQPAATGQGNLASWVVTAGASHGGSETTDRVAGDRLGWTILFLNNSCYRGPHIILPLVMQGAREMAWSLGILAALSEYPGSSPRIHNYQFSSRGQDALFWPPQAPGKLAKHQYILLKNVL